MWMQGEADDAMAGESEGMDGGGAESEKEVEGEEELGCKWWWW